MNCLQYQVTHNLSPPVLLQLCLEIANLLREHPQTVSHMTVHLWRNTFLSRQAPDLDFHFYSTLLTRLQCTSPSVALLSHL